MPFRYYEYLLTSSEVTKNFNTTPTYDQMRSQILTVNVFYDSLTYTSITQDAKMELFDLVSNLGGLLGLVKKFL